ncbi:MAG TPA: beta-propeller fold lactonase family protein [Terriglobales bacterium]|jgi:6-phosphogluconolactonase|nr:beta-propeller fold lactonase family protein [Terriglobales bacterium]
MKTKECLKRAVAMVLALPLSLGLACGKSGLGNGPLVPTCDNCPAPPEFLYATSPGAIVGFKIDQSTGALGSPLTMAGPSQSLGMAAAITFGRLYVSDFVNNTLQGFSINSSTGGLNAIPGSPFSLGGTPPGAGGVSPFVSSGSYLYVTNLNAGVVAGLTDESPTGALNTVPGSPFPAGDTPVEAVVAGSQNQFLYVSNLNDSAGGISAFTIDFNTGALTPMPGSPYATGAAGSFPGPSALAISGNDQTLYVGLVGTTNANNKIAAFAIDANTGALTPIPGSPFTTGNAPQYMAIVPVTFVAGTEFLYTANVQDKTISGFIVDGNSGSLTPLSGSPYHGATSLGDLAVTPTSTSANFFLYAADPQAKTVLAFTIDGTTGALTPVSGSPFPAGKAPTLLTVANVPVL